MTDTQESEVALQVLKKDSEQLISYSDMDDPNSQDPCVLKKKMQILKNEIVYLECMVANKGKEATAIQCFKRYKERMLGLMIEQYTARLHDRQESTSLERSSTEVSSSDRNSPEGPAPIALVSASTSASVSASSSPSAKKSGKRSSTEVSSSDRNSPERPICITLVSSSGSAVSASSSPSAYISGKRRSTEVSSSDRNSPERAAPIALVSASASASSSSPSAHTSGNQLTSDVDVKKNVDDRYVLKMKMKKLKNEILYLQNMIDNYDNDPRHLKYFQRFLKEKLRRAVKKYNDCCPFRDWVPPARQESTPLEKSLTERISPDRNSSGKLAPIASTSASEPTSSSPSEHTSEN